MIKRVPFYIILTTRHNEANVENYIWNGGRFVKFEQNPQQFIGLSKTASIRVFNELTADSGALAEIINFTQIAGAAVPEYELRLMQFDPVNVKAITSKTIYYRLLNKEV